MSSLTILNFHGVGPIPRDIDAGEHHCWLERDAFEAALDLVVGQPHVRLTVDDGNASDYDYILPALLQRSLKAEFFVCSGRLDQPTFLTRGQVRDLSAHGMGIGSHGAVHRPWRRLDAPDLESEVVASKQAIEAVLGHAISTAACPFGAYDRRVLAGLKRAGYDAVYTSDGGRTSDHSWLRPRTTLTRAMSHEQIRKIVTSGTGAVRQASIWARTLMKRLR